MSKKTPSPYKGKRILVLEGYARQCLPFLKHFHKCGCKTTVLCDSKLDVAYVSRYADKKVLGVCNSEQLSRTVEWVDKLIFSNDYDLVIPMGDLSAEILSSKKKEYEKYCIIASNDDEIFKLSQDKQNVMLVCEQNNIPAPKTLQEVSCIDDIEKSQLEFPLAIKPRRSCGARGFFKVNSLDELKSIVDEYNISLPDQVIQEFIPQSEMNLSANFYIDKQGNVKSAFIYGCLRWFPLNGGTGTFNMTVHKPQVIEQCTKLIEIFGLRGNIGIDLMYDTRDDQYKILEINPRIMACAKIGFDAGVNLAEQVLQDAFGDEVIPMLDYEDGIRVRMSQTDILWFLKSPDRFRAKPSWFNIRKTKDQTFSLADPLPWFAFLIRGLKNYKAEKAKRQM